MAMRCADMVRLRVKQSWRKDHAAPFLKKVSQLVDNPVIEWLNETHKRAVA